MQISAFELIFGFSRALDMVKPQLAGHHLGVAWISDELGRALNLPSLTLWQIFVAAMLHDAGAIPLRVSTDDLLFERKTWLHSRAGWALLSRCSFLKPMAELVLFHHTPWSRLRNKAATLFPANIIHLADRLELLLRADNGPVSLSELKHRLPDLNTQFRPELVEALYQFSHRHADFFPRPSREDMERDLRSRYAHIILDPDHLISFCFLFSLITDFRSPFTATHTAGVAHTACILHRRHMLRTEGRVDREQNRKVFVAGLLHDIGKLGIPGAILEKEGPLDHDEFDQMKRHAELSLSLLDGIPGFEDIRIWGALHHERLNGKGYPLGLTAEQIPLPSRIMAVADIFTALLEDRPYRTGMPLAHALDIIQTMEHNGHLDSEVLLTLRSNAEHINKVRAAAQLHARKRLDSLYRICAAPPEADISHTISG